MTLFINQLQYPFGPFKSRWPLEMVSDHCSDSLCCSLLGVIIQWILSKSFQVVYICYTLRSCLHEFVIQSVHCFFKTFFLAVTVQTAFAAAFWFIQKISSKSFQVRYICYTLRSWLHEICIRFRSVSLQLHGNDASKWTSANSPNTT